MADAFFVLRVLAHADIELILPDDGRGQEVAARPGAAQLVNGLSGVAEKLPDDVTRFRIQTVQIAVAARKNDLWFAAGIGVDGVGPLAVHNSLGRIVLFPRQFSGLLVDGNETRRI